MNVLLMAMKAKCSTARGRVDLAVRERSAQEARILTGFAQSVPFCWTTNGGSLAAVCRPRALACAVKPVPVYALLRSRNVALPFWNVDVRPVNVGVARRPARIERPSHNRERSGAGIQVDRIADRILDFDGHVVYVPSSGAKGGVRNRL